jgi:ADP-ribosyl-[dinitrogen reductase] hydrolase
MSDWFEHYGFAEVADGLVVGAYPQDGRDVVALREEGVTRVFNLVRDLEYEQAGGREACAVALADAGIEEERIEIEDFGSLLPGQLERAVSVIGDWLEDGERVYLHCRAGWQRSAAVAAGVVAVRDGIGLDEALVRIRERKPTAEPLRHQRADLARWWEARAAR